MNETIIILTIIINTLGVVLWVGNIIIWGKIIKSIKDKKNDIKG